MDQQEMLDQARLFRKAGRLPEAEQLYAAILKTDPGNFDALHLLGGMRFQQGRNQEALRLTQAALDIKKEPKVLCNLGSMLKSMGRLDEALANYNLALAIAPFFSDALYNRATTHLDMKCFGDALKDFDALLSTQPEDADALHNRATTLLNLRRYDEAAIDYGKVIAVQPDNICALLGHGVALRYLKQYDEARASFGQALKIDPNFLDALYNRAYMEWFDCGRYEAALRDFEAACKIDPTYHYILGDILHLRMYGADWRDYEPLVATINASVRAGKAVVSPFVYQAVSDSPADLQSCSVSFSNHRYPAERVKPFAYSANSKIRLGYLSGEFGDHATSCLTAGLYELHDKSKFEIVAFDNGLTDGSALRKRIESAFGRMVTIANLSDQEATDRVRAEKIDILIDLNGYFGLGRPGVFAKKPAPVQVNYLGFPATLGTACMDYIVADRWVIPEDEKQFYTEKVVYLPDTYQANDFRRPIAEAIPGRAECELPQDAFIFCNFNQSYKLTPATFALWMRILRKVENSVLWLLESNATCAENLRREAARFGVCKDRLVFAPRISADRHLSRLKLADLFLDSLPYNAHTTASDALWAGLPILTCYGKSFAGRVAASLLHAIALPELIANDSEEYVSLALRLVFEPEFRQSIRKKLSDNRLTTPLFDTDRFRKSLEAAYGIMVDRVRAGHPAQSFAVTI